MQSRLAPALLVISAFACSSSDTTAPPTPAHPIQARFELSGSPPSFLDVPFPSDAYLDPDGTIADAIPGLAGYVKQNSKSIEAALATQHGFGLLTGASFRIDEPGRVDDRTGDVLGATIDASSLPKDAAATINDDSPVFLLDLDAGARVPCRAGAQDDRARGSNSPPVLSVLPARGVVLAEGHRHAVVLTTRVTADGGLPIGASATFAAIRDGKQRAAPLEKLYGDAVDAVKKLVPALADGSHIAALTVFTTHADSHELVDLRGVLAKLPPPKLHWDPASVAPMHAAVFGATMHPGFTATLDDWLGAPDKLMDGTDDPATDQPNGAAHDALAALGTAEFDGTSFLRERPMGYEDPQHRTFARDASGKPVVDPDKPTAKIWIAIALPKAPPPASGYPVVIIQHGLQSDKSFITALANTFAEKGWASVAIDEITFGARAVLASETVDEKSVFRWSDKAKYAGPDGFVDEQAKTEALFGNFLSFGAARDQLRQAALDLCSVVELVRDPALDLGPLLAAVPGAKLDPDRIAYASDSFGSVIGSMVAAIDPHIRVMMLNVGGGGILTELVSNAPALATMAGTPGGLTFGIPRDRFTWTHPIVDLLQGILDAGDPLSYAKRIVTAPATVNGATNAPKSLVLTEVVWDELVANEGGEALALAAGLPLAVPNVGPNAVPTIPLAPPTAGVISGVPVAGATAVLVQVSPATHGCDLYCRQGFRHYKRPFDPSAGVQVLPEDVLVKQPYLGLQKMTVELFESAFTNSGPPALRDIPVPVRD